MQLVRTTENLALRNTACAIGMFDGIHAGHRLVLENAIREARSRGLQSVVFSFANHPQALLAKTPTALLTTLQDRLTAFEAMGFDTAVILDFDETLRDMTATAFVHHLLVDHLGVKHVTVGYDHRFGKDRTGDTALLSQLGKQYGFETTVIDPVRVTDLDSISGQIVSSTLIRKLISHGNLMEANHLLGHPYGLTGTVVSGFQRGRTLGFPTANLAVPADRLIPGVGAYVVTARIGGTSQPEQPAVCNIGFAPTFEDAEPVKRVEVHLLDYAGDSFYNETLTVRFLKRLRPELSFTTVETLVRQIETDCRQARQLFAHPSHSQTQS
ncbi:MAG: bifunctional riboflavin kinase/FAD synthetase [Candidatus Melainabacteria bacterium]